MRAGETRAPPQNPRSVVREVTVHSRYAPPIPTLFAIPRVRSIPEHLLNVWLKLKGPRIARLPDDCPFRPSRLHEQAALNGLVSAPMPAIAIDPPNVANAPTKPQRIRTRSSTFSLLRQLYVPYDLLCPMTIPYENARNALYRQSPLGHSSQE